MIQYPDLGKEKIIAIDTETYDPELLSKGSGVYRNDGYVLGVSIALENGFNEYYSLNHKDTPIEVRSKNLRYLKDNLKYNNDKLGANINYDLDWLCNSKLYNFKIGGTTHDVQIAEPLLNEYARSYSLQNLSEKYLGRGKKSNRCEQFCASHGLKGDFRQHLYLMPFDMVREYAKEDTLNPLEIFKKQKEKLSTEGLSDLYDLEISLLPLMLQMRKVGIRVDLEKAYDTRKTLEKKLIELEDEFYKKYGDINYRSTKDVEKLFLKYGLDYDKNDDTGNATIDQHKLKGMADEVPFCKDILNLKKLYRTIHTVFDNVIIESSIDGRIHSTLASLKTDDNGTVTGRFANFNPNLQQIPSKDDTYAEESRGCFIPEELYDLGCLDASQIEYRIFSHYTSGIGSDDLRLNYNTDPNTDYHRMIELKTGLHRKIAKNLNFGLMYGMGVEKCAKQFYWTPKEAKLFVSTYHKEMPCLKTTMNAVAERAKQKGYIKTLLGRHSRVNDFIRMYHKEYVMFNKLIQGSAADHLKKTMSDAYKAGIFNVLIPHLTVHDELDVSIPRTKEGKEAIWELKNIMQTCVKLKVPIKAELKIGANWAVSLGKKAINSKEEIVYE